MPIDEADPRPAPERSYRLLRAGALAFAAALQTVLLLRSPAIGKDGMTFIWMAQKLAEDPREAILAADQHPGYPALILAGRWCFGFLARDEFDSWIVGGRAVNFIFGLLVVVLIAGLSRRLLGARAAAAAASIVAVTPLFRSNAADAMSDTPCLAFYLGGALCLIRAIDRRSVASFAAAAALSGLAYLIRPEGLGVAIVGSLFLLAAAARRETRAFALRALLLVLVACAAFAIPYVAVKGKLTGKKDVMRLLDAGLSRAGASARGAYEIAFVFVEDGMRCALLVPLILGIAARGRVARAEPAARRIVVALAAMHLVFLMLLFLIAGYMAHRHVMVLTALSMPWIGRGILVAAGDRGRVAAVITAAFVLGFGYRAVRPLHILRLPLREAGLWVRANTRPDDRILTNSRYVFFYANRGGRLIERAVSELPELAAAGPPPYALLVFEQAEWPWGGPILEAAARSYAERVVPDVSGGGRRLLIMAPRARR